MGSLGLRSLKGQSITNSICWVISMAPAGIFVNRFFGAVKPIQMDKTTHKIPTKKIVMKSLNSWGETKMDVHQDPPQ